MNEPMPGWGPDPAYGPEQREQARRALSHALAAEVARGGRVESQTDSSAIVVTGSKPNHVLHLILTLVTCLAWGIVWIILAVVQKEHRTSITVDPYGQVLRQPLT